MGYWIKTGLKRSTYPVKAWVESNEVEGGQTDLQQEMTDSKTQKWQARRSLEIRGKAQLDHDSERLLTSCRLHRQCVPVSSMLTEMCVFSGGYCQILFFWYHCNYHYLPIVCSYLLLWWSCGCVPWKCASTWSHWGMFLVHFHIMFISCVLSCFTNVLSLFQVFSLPLRVHLPTCVINVLHLCPIVLPSSCI